MINALPLYQTSSSYDTQTTYSNKLKVNGKIVQIGTDEDNIYTAIAQEKTINQTTILSNAYSDKTTIDGIKAIYTYLKTNVEDEIRFFPNVTGSLKATIDESQKYLDWKLDLNAFQILTGNPFKFARRHLQDAPYDMFIVPINTDKTPVKINIKDVYTIDITDTTGYMEGVQEIVKQMGTNLYDLQLLPYCPLKYELDVNGNIYINTADFESEENISRHSPDFYWFYNSNVDLVLFFPFQSNFSLNESQIHLYNGTTKIDLPLKLDNKKLSNECDLYRLVSPNYNGQFEFNNAKIEGITGFNVDCTYLPYSPYIHVNPLFKGLYGNEFDDARGLICQGDFSVSYLSDAWIQYQINNKNYANTFNRQIQNMEVTQDVERKKQVFQATMGAIGGGAAGAIMGAKGGIAGAIAGAAVGTAAGAIGGALDVKYGDVLRNEALDYTKDMFNYSLDNIKALPDSIAKVTAYTKNNKIFPILEYYTCTDKEKLAIANKIIWNGMTVMRIDVIQDFLGNTWSYLGNTSKGYIKGKLIRVEGIEDDYHVINAIAGELDKGAYFE